MKLIRHLLFLLFFLFTFFYSNDANAVIGNSIVKQNENFNSGRAEFDDDAILIFKDGILQSSIRIAENIPLTFRGVNPEIKSSIHPLIDSNFTRCITFYCNTIRNFNTSLPIYISFRVLLI